MEIEEAPKHSLLGRVLMRWRLITVATLVVLFAGMLLITMMFSSSGACGCGGLGEGDRQTIEAEGSASATASAASSAPLPSATPAPTPGLLWPKPVQR